MNELPDGVVATEMANWLMLYCDLRFPNVETASEFRSGIKQPVTSKRFDPINQNGVTLRVDGRHSDAVPAIENEIARALEAGAIFENILGARWS